jgi:hypothetical protein
MSDAEDNIPLADAFADPDDDMAFISIDQLHSTRAYSTPSGIMRK